MSVRCPKCHSKIDDDCKFCPKCGQELICACPNCGKQNDYSSRFCKFCGAVIKEGKETSKKKPIQEPDKSERNGMLPVIFSTISISGLFLAVVLMLGFAFLPFQIDSFYPAGDYTIIGYSAGLINYGFNNLASQNQFFLIANVFILFILLLAIIALSVLFIIRNLPKLIKGIKEKGYYDFSKLPSIIYIIFVATTVFFVGFVLNQSGVYSKPINGAIIFVLIFVPVLLVFNSFTKEYIQNNFNLKKALLISVPRLLLFVFTFVMVLNLGGYRFHADIKIYTNTYGETPYNTVQDFGNSGLASFFLKRANDITSDASVYLIPASIYSIVSFFLELFILVLSVIIIRRALATPIDKPIKRISGLVFSGIILVFSILTVVFNRLTNTTLNRLTISEKTFVYVKSLQISSASTICVVMASLMLLCYVAISIIEATKKGEKQ